VTPFGHGKVILLGEHAVVYGHPALAGALELGVLVTAHRSARWRVSIDEWDLDVHDGPIVTAVQQVAAPDPGPWHIDAHATLPSRAGLGSSAALLVACARAMGPPGLAPQAIEAAAQAGERVFHGNPSGIDVALATRGGLGLFRRGHGLSPLSAAPFTLAIGLSGEPRDTAACVAEVARRREIDADIDRRLGAMGELALAGEHALRHGDVVALGPMFDAAHAYLATLAVSTARLDRLCAIARAAGALGAKLTGAGGGGAVIALAPGREAEILEAWRAAGFDGLVAQVGVKP
jgi:mevalonate kinase